MGRLYPGTCGTFTLVSNSAAFCASRFSARSNCWKLWPIILNPTTTLDLLMPRILSLPIPWRRLSAELVPSTAARLLTVSCWPPVCILCRASSADKRF